METKTTPQSLSGLIFSIVLREIKRKYLNQGLQRPGTHITSILPQKDT